MKNLTRYLQRARRGAQMTLCWVVVAVTALCGIPTAGFALQDDSRDELYGDVVNPLTSTVNDRECTFVDIDDGKLEGRTSMYDNVSFYTAAVKKVLPNWASLAYNILVMAEAMTPRTFCIGTTPARALRRTLVRVTTFISMMRFRAATVSIPMVPTNRSRVV